MQKYLAPNKVKFTMSGNQPNIVRHEKTQKNITCNQKEKGNET